MNKAKLVIFVLGALAGSAAGFFYGQRRGRDAGTRDEHARLLADPAIAAAASGKTHGPAASAKTMTAAEAAAAASRLVPPPAGFEKLSLEEILATAGPMDRFQAIMAFVQRVPKAEIEPALKRLRQQMQGRFDPETMFATHLLMTRLGSEDPKAAMATLKGLDMWGQGFGTSTVLATLAAKDPLAAAEYFKDPDNPLLNMPQAGGMMAGAVAKEWAKKDPEAALAWAKSLKDGLRGSALGSIVGSMAVDDPAKAALMATSLNLDKGEDRNRLMGQVAQSWAARDPDAALKWVASLPAGEERDSATRQALDSWSNVDPVAAAAHLDQVTNPKDRDQLIGAVAGPWARRDPAATAGWLQQQPEGKGREEGMRNVMWMWTNTDPTAASTWLSTQPAGPSKDEGIVALANQTFATDPEAAVTWAATIGDDMKRKIQLKRGVEGWLKKDEPAARQWLQSSAALNPDEKGKLLEGVTPK